MSHLASITIREVESSDFDTFYGHQLDPEAIRLARAATTNIWSIRVLRKCVFKIVGRNKGFANGRGEKTEEYILRLDLNQANG